MTPYDRLKDILDTHFCDERKQLRRLISRYGELYNLPILEDTFSCEDESFQTMPDGIGFVVVAAFDTQDRILIRDASNQSAYSTPGPHLLGTTVETLTSFCLEEAASELVSEHIDVEVLELQPLAIVTNHFRCKNGQIKTHEGIAFAAFIGDAPSDVKNGVFLESAPGNLIFQNGGIFKEAKKYICDRPFETPTEEAISGSRNIFVSNFHHYVVKNLLHSTSSGKIRRRIKSHISRCNSYLDASCGDDSFILEISSEYDPTLIVANDISWSAMDRLRKKSITHNYNVIFTNHNLCDLPFKTIFDVVVWKNTLHHISSSHQLIEALDTLKRLSKKLIIVDIEEPSRTRRGKMLNFYYENIYGDAGDFHRFFTRSTFKNLVEAAFAGRQIVFENIPTIKGTYMLAAIDLD